VVFSQNLFGKFLQRLKLAGIFFNRFVHQIGVTGNLPQLDQAFEHIHMSIVQPDLINRIENFGAVMITPIGVELLLLWIHGAVKCLLNLGR